MIEIIFVLIGVLIIAGAVQSIIESIFEGLKQVLLILLIIIAVIGTIVLQIYLISRWGLTVIKAGVVIALIIWVASGIYYHFRGQ